MFEKLLPFWKDGAMLAKLNCDKVSRREMFVLEQILHDLFSAIQLVCSILSLLPLPLAGQCVEHHQSDHG